MVIVFSAGAAADVRLTNKSWAEALKQCRNEVSNNRLDTV